MSPDYIFKTVYDRTTQTEENKYDMSNIYYQYIIWRNGTCMFMNHIILNSVADGYTTLHCKVSVEHSPGPGTINVF